MLTRLPNQCSLGQGWQPILNNQAVLSTKACSRMQLGKNAPLRPAQAQLLVIRINNGTYYVTARAGDQVDCSECHTTINRQHTVLSIREVGSYR
jgi:hypothetical protein